MRWFFINVLQNPLSERIPLPFSIFLPPVIGLRVPMLDGIHRVDLPLLYSILKLTTEIATWSSRTTNRSTVASILVEQCSAQDPQLPSACVTPVLRLASNACEWTPSQAHHVIQWSDSSPVGCTWSDSLRRVGKRLSQLLGSASSTDTTSEMEVWTTVYGWRG